MSVCACVSLTLVADEAHPAIRTIAASFPLITFSPVRTVITGQTAVAAKSVVQTHWRRHSGERNIKNLITANLQLLKNQ